MSTRTSIKFQICSAGTGFRVNGIAVFATNFRISIALQIICVANCDAIPVKLFPECVEKHRQLSKLCMSQASTRLEYILVVDAELASEVGERR